MKFTPPIPSCSNENFCFHLGDYSFGFQAQEQDEEMWGGSVTYKYRVEDPRLGRFFSVDPLFSDFPWNSNYAFSENRIIDAIELEGLECIAVHSRSFAPYDTFGGGFTGDGNNRCFGDYLIENYEEKKFNSRIRASVEIDLNANKIMSQKLGKTWSENKSKNSGAWSPTYFQEETTYKNGELFFQMQGNDKALNVPNWMNAGYIDVKVEIAFSFVGNGVENKWRITGEVYGDRYPSNETFIEDGCGNKLFLGASAVDNESEYGPQKELLGTAQENMSKFQFNIVFNTDGSFRGVSLDNGDWYTLEQWNQKFTTLNPKDSAVGTNITKDGVETNYK